MNSVQKVSPMFSYMIAFGVRYMIKARKILFW